MIGIQDVLDYYIHACPHRNLNYCETNPIHLVLPEGSIKDDKTKVAKVTLCLKLIRAPPLHSTLGP